MKITSYDKIPQFTRHGSWECDYDPDRLIATLDEWTAERGLDLNPDFQRGHVWTAAQQSAYIEFFLKGGKTARVVYLNDPCWHRERSGYTDFVLVDGKQRVEAWRQFFANKIRVFGSFAEEFTDRMRIASNTMKLNVNDLKTRREVLQWYLDFNSGGVVHSDAELNRVRELLEKEPK